MRRILPVFVISLFLVLAAPVKADLVLPILGCQTLKFDLSEDGFTAVYGSYSSGNGWREQDNIVSNRQYSILQIRYTAAEPFEITRTSFTYDATLDAGTPSDGLLPVGVILRLDGVIVASNNTGRTAAGNNQTRSLNYVGMIDQIDYQVYVGNDDVGDTSNGYALIKSAEVCNTGALTKPLQATDYDEWGMYKHLDTEAVVAFSDAPGAYVFAAMDGTVTSVKKGIHSRCADLIGDAFDLYCDVTVPGSVNGTGNNFVYSLEADGINSFDITTGLNVQMVAYEVVISTVYGDLTYYVADAPDYITEGTQISQGCFLGKTLRMYGVSLDIVGFDVGAQRANEGVTILALDNDELSFIDLLTINPVQSNACNVPDDEKDCIGDTRLSRPADWQTRGGAAWNDPGVTLAGRASLFAQYNLDPNQLPRMRVSARTYAGTAEMRLKIGQTEQTFTVTSGGFKDYEIAGGAHQPDTGGFHTILVSNESSNSIEIEYICVAFTEGEDEDPPPACYFDNYTFNDGLDSWTVLTGNFSEVAGEIKSNGTGYAVVGQNVKLFQEAERTYTFYVDVGLHYNEAFSVAAARIDNDTAIEVSYYYPGLGQGGFTVLQSATYAQLFATGADNQYRAFDEFTVSADTDATFEIRVRVPTPKTGGPGVVIREACINPGDGPDWPGYDDDPPTEPEPEPFPADCNAIAFPQGESIGAWISWHWHNLRQFFECDLMVLLNNMYRTAQRTYTLIGWGIRYSQAAGIQAVNWLSSDFLYWLGGYLGNAAGGVTIVDDDSDSGGCRWWDVVCHLGNALDFGETLWAALSDLFNNILKPLFDALWGVLDFAFGLLWDVITTIVEFVVSVVKSILGFIGDVIALITGLITEWNTAPEIAPPGLPDCDINPQDSVICWIYFIVDETIFAGTWGSLIMPIFVSIIWIQIVIWFAGQISEMMKEAGQSL